LKSAKDPKKIITKQDLIPEGIVYKENVRLIEGEKEIIFDENCQQDVEKYGRMFLLFDFLPKNIH